MTVDFENYNEAFAYIVENGIKNWDLKLNKDNTVTLSYELEAQNG